MISNLTKKRIHDYLAEGKRAGRGLLDYREIEIETGVSKNAEGSARVRIGKTEVMAGVKLDVTEPYTDHEGEGTLITTLELLPLSSPRFEAGPPRIEAIETARIVDREIRESKFIDFEKLCIKKGEKVWGIFLDVFSINDDGNLLDAACIAAVAALVDARLPEYDEKAERVKFGEWTAKKLPLTKELPLILTFHKIGNRIFLDPSQDEEEASEGRISLGFLGENINACQKGNGSPLEIKELGEILDIAEKKAKEVTEKVEKLIEKALKAKKDKE
jgi:exosome complex component RRP42